MAPSYSQHLKNAVVKAQNELTNAAKRQSLTKSGQESWLGVEKHYKELLANSGLFPGKLNRTHISQLIGEATSRRLAYEKDIPLAEKEVQFATTRLHDATENWNIYREHETQLGVFDLRL